MKAIKMDVNIQKFHRCLGVCPWWGGGLHLEGDLHPGGGVLHRGGSASRAGGLHPGGSASVVGGSIGQTPLHRILRDTVNERAARNLLECIHIISLFFLYKVFLCRILQLMLWVLKN